MSDPLIVSGAPCVHCGESLQHRRGCVVLLRSCSIYCTLGDCTSCRSDLCRCPHHQARIEQTEPKFVAVLSRVKSGARTVASAESKTMAKRIANALNRHKVNSEGV